MRVRRDGESANLEEAIRQHRCSDDERFDISMNSKRS